MKRALLSVGCDTYLMSNSLNGAENDARAISTSLVGPGEHQYDSRSSQVSFSPTAEEFRQSLSNVVYASNLAVFTLYFAGHAAVVDETLYLCFKDTNPDRVASTAVGFPEILRASTAARPKQINFVLDACQTNGLGFDLASILKRAIVGGSESIGISFVASAAANESALETEEGGSFTVELIKVIQGQKFIQRERPFLNLAEISQKMQMEHVISGQTLSYWTLNLQGPNLFTKNPHYFGPAQIADQIAFQISENAISPSALSEEFKAAIFAAPRDFNERGFAKIFETVLEKIEPAHHPNLIYGLAESFRTELISSEDCFLEARLYTLLLGQLVRTDSNESKMYVTDQIILWLIDAIRRALTSLQSAINEHESVLLVELFSDLFDLPVRLSDIFGQCALFLLCQPKPSPSDTLLVKSLFELMLAVYGNSVLSVSDEQATGYLLTLELCRKNQWTDIGEEIVGRLYGDLLKTSGRCGAYELDAEERLELLLGRYEGAFSYNHDLYNQPSDLVSVVLFFAALYTLDEAVDYSLIQIDHTSINFFVPDTFRSFGAVNHLAGTNYTLTLGRDFWRCIDLRRISRDILSRFNVESLSRQDLLCSYAAALSLRDRLPWHVIDKDTTI